MKLKYTIDNNGICFDKCPFNKTDKYMNDIKVGSYTCYQCKHSFKTEEKDTILCNGK